MTWLLAVSIILWALGANLASDVYPLALEQQGIYDPANRVHKVAVWLCIACWPLMEGYELVVNGKQKGE